MHSDSPISPRLLDSGRSKVPLDYPVKRSWTVNATNKLLDIYAEVCGASLDKDIATKLRVTKQAVSNWRKEHAHPDAESVGRMCDATGQSVAHWLPLIEADRARSPEARKVWLRLAQAAATIALVVFSGSPNKATACEHKLSIDNEHSQVSPVYIMRNYGRAKAWLKRTGTRLAQLLAHSHGPRSWQAKAVA
jgi:transcriptional regulator with XRE-family HTH domain